MGSLREKLLVTPSLAAFFLQHNHPDNRPLDPEKAKAHLGILDKGYPVPVQFEGGFLVNGQHRLTALVEGGRSVEMMVEWK